MVLDACIRSVMYGGEMWVLRCERDVRVCWLGVTKGCSGIWLGSRDKIGCVVRRCEVGML